MANDRFDALSDERLSRLQADISLFKELGINTIFAYSIDVSKSHDRAMKLLEEAGIYVLVAATTPRKCIRRNDPPASYTASLLQHYFKTLDVMSQYKNTLGVLAANVLVNNHASEACVPVIAAVVRGMKQYMRLKADATGQRILPVGYAAAASDDRNLALENSLPGFSPKSWSSESKSFGSKSSASAISQAVDVDVGLLLLGEVNVARCKTL